ncbi:hypothetical protein PMIN01_11815 [Paraphaeosphaeria minitans]|uniref:Uncharacterized protein n=1 Tax=Paraphaeosphaeria minitans TaxID=565426 RepID=A0A9P6G6R9_9PLEO|nr:hypothetical protein PMIN01_11815 [Paraphaeosphaeria minitans]
MSDIVLGSTGAQPDHPPLASVSQAQAKRVILRLRVNEFSEGNPEYDDAIKTYLAFDGRPATELEGDRHYAHIEPFQDPELRQTRFHITLDMEQNLTKSPDFAKLPHEVYHIRRNKHGKFQVTPIENSLERENLLAKIRQFSDLFYPWGRTKQEERS